MITIADTAHDDPAFIQFYQAHPTIQAMYLQTRTPSIMTHFLSQFPQVDIMDYDKPFIQFYQTYPTLQTLDLQTRVATIAHYFLGQPYHFEPLGEGAEGLYSNLPLYRADQFDCVTFVDTVLALAHASDFTQFKQTILSIRYANEQVDYTQRTDWFTDLEWNPHLQRLGYIQDATLSLLDENKNPVATDAQTTINKPEWYAQKIISNLDLPQLSAEEAQQRLTQLRAEGKKFTAQSSILSYIPLTTLFDSQGQPNSALWKQFPPVAVIEIVRPNWHPVNPKDKKTDYGTHLNVAHVGIAIHTASGIIFYHAASGNAVVNIPLTDYLHSFLDDKRPDPIKGIHIEKII